MAKVTVIAKGDSDSEVDDEVTTIARKSSQKARHKIISKTSKYYTIEVFSEGDIVTAKPS